MPASTQALTDTRTLRPVTRHDGAYFVGRPEWMTDDLFGGLQRECRELSNSAPRRWNQRFGDLGPVGREFCASDLLHAFVERHAGPARYTGFANYRYYDIPNSRVEPHVDNESFTFNVIVMLDHQYVSERRSGLLLFPHGPDPVTIVLEPGELIIFNAKDVIHARTPISEKMDETAANLGIGFTPAGELNDPQFWHPATGWTPA